MSDANCQDCKGTGLHSDGKQACWGCQGLGTEKMRLNRLARAAKQGGFIQASAGEIAKVEAHASAHAAKAEHANSLHTSINPAVRS